MLETHHRLLWEDGSICSRNLKTVMVTVSCWNPNFSTEVPYWSPMKLPGEPAQPADTPAEAAAQTTKI